MGPQHTTGTIEGTCTPYVSEKVTPGWYTKVLETAAKKNPYARAERAKILGDRFSESVDDIVTIMEDVLSPSRIVLRRYVRPRNVTARPARTTNRVA